MLFSQRNLVIAIASSMANY